MSEAAGDAPEVTERWRNEIAKIRPQLVGALKQEAADRGFTRVALGLSGGLDSTVAAALCVEALGAANVLGVLMPVRTSDATSLSLAQGVVNALGITSRRVNMSPVLDAYFANFPDANRDRRGQCLAWLRIGVLLDLGLNYGAAIVQALNRTDRVLGYGEAKHELTTSVKPLAGLFKTQVRLLGDLVEVLPEVRRRRPSLDYWAGQSDEADLGLPYSAIDPALEALVQRGLAPAAAVAEGLAPDAVEWADARLAAWRLQAAARCADPEP
jgi:NAD+ synthase